MFATVEYSFVKDASINNFSSPAQNNSFIFKNCALKNPRRNIPFSQTIPKAKIKSEKRNKNPTGFLNCFSTIRNHNSANQSVLLCDGVRFTTQVITPTLKTSSHHNDSSTNHTLPSAGTVC